MDLRTGLDRCGKSRSHRNSISGQSSSINAMKGSRLGPRCTSSFGLLRMFLRTNRGLWPVLSLTSKQQTHRGYNADFRAWRAALAVGGCHSHGRQTAQYWDRRQRWTLFGLPSNDMCYRYPIVICWKHKKKLYLKLNYIIHESNELRSKSYHHETTEDGYLICGNTMPDFRDYEDLNRNSRPRKLRGIAEGDGSSTPNLDTFYATFRQQESMRYENHALSTLYM